MMPCHKRSRERGNCGEETRSEGRNERTGRMHLKEAVEHEPLQLADRRLDSVLLLAHAEDHVRHAASTSHRHRLKEAFA